MICRSLKRPAITIADFLTVLRIDQLIYPPRFLAQYQRWWSLERPMSVVDIEFAVLLLRICSYASQFLPSPTHTIDRIRGMLLADIHNACDDIATNLSVTCARLDARGSLLRVQHLAYDALISSCEGRISASWETLSCTIRVAQRVGIHSGTVTWMHGIDEIEREMRRRTFCNLYIWDRYEDWHRESRNCADKRLTHKAFCQGDWIVSRSCLVAWMPRTCPKCI